MENVKAKVKEFWEYYPQASWQKKLLQVLVGMNIALIFGMIAELFGVPGRYGIGFDLMVILGSLVLVALLITKKVKNDKNINV
jgi:hypothetical protein